MSIQSLKRYASTNIELGAGGIELVDDRYDFEILFPPGDAEVCSAADGSAELWKLERIAATLNEDNPAEAQPVTDPQAGFRSYFIEYTPRVCEIKDTPRGQRTIAMWFELQRVQRVPLAGWYAGDVGVREMMDTNFGKGHRVPVKKAGNMWVLLLTSRLPATKVLGWDIVLDWSMTRFNPLRWVN